MLYAGGNDRCLRARARPPGARRDRGRRWRSSLRHSPTRIATGLAERRRRYVVRFGYVFSALDFTLAWRMLLRYPGLSIVSVFGMAVGIAVADGAFALISMLMDPRLPLPDGERIVSMLNVDASTSNSEMRLVRDFEAWRGLTSVEDIGIARTVSRNLLVEGRSSEPVTAVELSASAFRVAGVEALRGRYLLPEDEAPGAAGAMVIGYDEWVRRFDGDPDIVGRSRSARRRYLRDRRRDARGLRLPVEQQLLDSVAARSVGVSSRGPGRSSASSAGSPPGATLESAQAELTELGRRAAAESPATHEHLRPRVMPYVYAYHRHGRPGQLPRDARDPVRAGPAARHRLRQRGDPGLRAYCHPAAARSRCAAPSAPAAFASSRSCSSRR